MKKPKQLALEQRYQIYILRKAGLNQTWIARHLRVHKSTISRELHRNRGGRVYRPRQAQRFADARRNRCANRILQQTWIRLEQLLREDWNPQQISRWFVQNEKICVSHESIYKHVKEDKMSGGPIFAAAKGAENAMGPPRTGDIERTASA